MTDHEFDVYWYKTLSIVVAILIKNDLNDINQKAIQPLLLKEENYEGASSPITVHNKFDKLLEAIEYIANNKPDGANLATLHENIKSELQVLYTLYFRRLSKSQLMFNNNTLEVGFEISNKEGVYKKKTYKEEVFVSRGLVGLICDYLDSLSYEAFRRTNKLRYRRLPPLPLLPINYQNYTIIKIKPQSITTALSVLPDRKILSASKFGWFIQVWDLYDLEISFKVLGDFYLNVGDVTALITLPDGKIVSGTKRGHILVWTLDDYKKPLFELRDGGRQGRITALGYIQGGKLVSGSEDGAIRVWNLNDPTSPPIVLSIHSEDIIALGVLSDRETVSASMDGTIRVCNLDNRSSYIVAQQQRVFALEVLPGRRIASGSYEGSTIRIYDVDKRTCIKLEDPECGGITTLKRLPDDRIVAGSKNGGIKIWNLINNTNIKLTTGHDSMITALGILPGGEIVSGSEDGIIRVWGCFNKEENIKINQLFIREVVSIYRNTVKNRKISFGIAGKRVNNEILPDNLAKVIIKVQSDTNILGLLPHKFVERFAKEIELQTINRNNAVKNTKLFTHRDDDITNLYSDPLTVLKDIWYNLFCLSVKRDYYKYDLRI
ncbi:hypothetical protein IB642_02005 [Allofrancisella guangzhouensis]|uniref:Uncharacterized protein n=1 Tax=Allofrancisella guangzhouensis TaxID=594679 RepID=A0A0A8E243_9GAMM|nr:hypothetical protein [Allofrancisella guangzhouensis]AJC48280.1 hypothetical protein SD28_00680 [Allofrancisella guangzhouensis]MBK2026634.1 hypothetical protein [Allofrancisella guangzhouensis]MBK2043791.1 hypothetical protein [Allofrancisella guangzhouensis]MBK2045621.1 hypothetical protein [Allofrancisella guangzhouensis]